MPYVYILTSDNTPRVYTGFTHDLNRRLAEHNSDSNEGWTCTHKPWRIDAYVEVDCEETGLIVEQYFKNSSGQEKFRNFAKDNPHHPHPRQGFFDALEEGRAFGRAENRFKMQRINNRNMFVIA